MNTNIATKTTPETSNLTKVKLALIQVATHANEGRSRKCVDLCAAVRLLTEALGPVASADALKIAAEQRAELGKVGTMPGLAQPRTAEFKQPKTAPVLAAPAAPVAPVTIVHHPAPASARVTRTRTRIAPAIAPAIAPVAAAPAAPAAAPVAPKPAPVKPPVAAAKPAPAVVQPVSADELSQWLDMLPAAEFTLKTFGPQKFAVNRTKSVATPDGKIRVGVDRIVDGQRVYFNTIALENLMQVLAA